MICICWIVAHISRNFLIQFERLNILYFHVGCEDGSMFCDMYIINIDSIEFFNENRRSFAGASAADLDEFFDDAFVEKFESELSDPFDQCTCFFSIFQFSGLLLSLQILKNTFFKGHVLVLGEKPCT